VFFFMETPSLDALLDAIPEENRHLLDHKIESRKSRATIAKSISNWRVVAQFIPNIENDIDGIVHDNHSLAEQKIGLLDKWKERNGPWATYRHLAECLYNAGAIYSVDVLCRELIGTQQNPISPIPTPLTPPQSPPQQVTSLPEPEMKELVNLIIMNKPYELGLELKINMRELSLLEANHPNNYARQLREVFSLYLRQTEEPSWVQVATALQAIGERKIARNIMDKFGFSLPKRQDDAGSRTPASTFPQPAPVHPAMPQSQPADRTSTALTPAVIRHRGRTEESKVEEPSTRAPLQTLLPESSQCQPQRENSPSPTHRGRSRECAPSCSVRYGAVFAVVIIAGLILYLSQASAFPAVSLSSIFDGYRSFESVPSTARPSTFPQNKAPKWLNMEPKMKLLHLIKYTDSDRNNKMFRLISEIQNSCKRLGTLLGITKATLDGFDSSLTLEEQCEKILDLWITRGDGEYSVTWAGLLQAMEDAELGGVAKHFREALTLAEVQ
jgi:hypothetical protein